MFETQYEALRRRGISRRSFLQFCSLTAASLGLGSAGAQEIAHAMETKPRTPVIWLHGLECTCCSEAFIRSYTPIVADVVTNMVSLDYDDTIMAAAGEQAEESLHEMIEKYKGNYILATFRFIRAASTVCLTAKSSSIRSSTSPKAPRL